MKRSCLFLYLLLTQAFFWGCDSKSSVEDPNKSYFVKFYGGDGDQTGVDMVALPDGTFVLFGTTKPSRANTYSQWWLVKTDANGMVLLDQEYGGPLDDEASDIELTNDGRLVVVGNTFRSATDRDIKIMTLDLNLVRIDSAILGNLHTTPTDEMAYSVTQTSDGFIVAGSTSDIDIKPTSSTGPVTGDKRDALHFRFDGNLDPYPFWSGATGPGTYDVAIKVIPVTPSSISPTTYFYVFGYSNTNTPGHIQPDYNYWVFGLGSTGIQTNSLTGIGLNDDEKLSAISLSPSPNDGYYLGGITNNASGLSDIYVSKVRTPLSFLSTDIQFQKPLSINLGKNLPEKTSVFSAQQGGFFVLANENGFNNNQNWILTKINIDGTSLWTLPIVFGGDGLDTCGGVQELPDGRLVIIGTMTTGQADLGETKMTLIKVNGEGKLLN